MRLDIYEGGNTTPWFNNFRAYCFLAGKKSGHTMRWHVTEELGRYRAIYDYDSNDRPYIEFMAGSADATMFLLRWS